MATFYPHIAVFFKEPSGKRFGVKVKRIMNFSDIDFQPRGMKYLSESAISDVSEFNSDAGLVEKSGVLTVSMTVPDGVYGLASKLQHAQGNAAEKFDVALYLGVYGETYQRSIELRGSHEIADVSVTSARLSLVNSSLLAQIVTFRRSRNVSK